MSIRRSDLAWITVSDIEKAKKFFVDKLGMKLNVEDATYGWLELSGSEEGGAVLGVGCDDEQNPVKPGHNAIMTFSVDDIVKTKEELEKKGVAFLSPIMKIPGHVKLVLFADEDGNKFQLVEDMSTAQ